MKIILCLHQGAVTAATLPQGVVIELRDYSVPADWESGVYKDAQGGNYQRVIVLPDELPLAPPFLPTEGA